MGVLGDLGIELVSPSGTRSVLMNAHNVFQKSETVVNLPLMSNAFNDEPAKGAWTLRVVDVNGRAGRRQARPSCATGRCASMAADGSRTPGIPPQHSKGIP